MLVLLTLIPFYIPELSAQTIHAMERRESLRGLKGFSVLVEGLREDITQAGLTESILKTDVELKLRKAGIRVVPKGAPRLYINVSSLSLKLQRGIIYSVRVEFLQDAILSRNHSIQTSLVTWKDSILGITPDLRDVREVVSDLVDQFMNDYLAVNPK